VALVGVSRYREITRDFGTDSATVTARIEEATEMIEQRLDRPLELLERTEVLILESDSAWGYLAYPRSTPIVSVPGNSVYSRYDDVTLRSVPPDGSPLFGTWIGSLPLVATVTWTGGFTSDTLPRRLERAIAELAHALEVDDLVPAGALSVRSGDQAVTYAPTSNGDDLDAYVPGLWGRIKKFRHRRRLGAGSDYMYERGGW
jgi:hypothetical protein